MSVTTNTVSVILPSYNSHEGIRKALTSIRKQSYENFELIIIDDGSDDGTIEVIRGISDDRIRLIVRENESGITSALNRGIDEASGKYIARHDADDWSAPERFEKQVEYLEANEEVALLGTGAHLVDEDGQHISQRRVDTNPSLDDLIEHNEFVHGSVMMRKDALESVGGYDEWFPTTEDYDLWLRLADEYEVRNIDEPLYYFRQHDDSLYGSNLEELKLYHLLAVRKVQSGLDAKLKREIDEHGIETLYERLTTDERRWFHAELAKENLRYGNLHEGRRHAKRLLDVDRTHPLAYALLPLSYTTPCVTKFAARTYRRLINAKIGLENRRS